MLSAATTVGSDRQSWRDHHCERGNQPTEDYGIDAHIEIVDNDRVTGQLVALQIKAGDSFFEEKAEGGWWFRPTQQHLDYWLNHSLPVVVVLVDIDRSGQCYWQAVNSETIEKGPKGGSRILIPEVSVLDRSAAAALREIAKGDPSPKTAETAARSTLDGSSGTRLAVEFKEWIAKINLGSIVLGIYHDSQEEPDRLAIWSM